MAASYNDIELEASEGYVTITLNRPHCLNAMSLRMVDELHTAFDAIERDKNTHVIILRGAGRAFCAGIDMKDGFGVLPGSESIAAGRYEVQQLYSRLTLRMREIPQPLIAAVHGYACGGGLSLAAACDIRLVAPSAMMNVAFIKVGLTGGDMGTSFLLPRSMSGSIASELMYTGRFMDAEEAVRAGFASRVVPEAELSAAASAIAEEIVENSPFGIRLTKEMINRSRDGAPLSTMIGLENRSQVLSSLTGAFDLAVERFGNTDRDATPSPSETGEPDG